MQSLKYKKSSGRYLHVMLMLLFAFGAETMLTSCRKGENDPAISLLPRRTRLLGDWKLTGGEYKRTSNDTLVTTTYSESAATTFHPVSGTSQVAHTSEIRFENDGKFSEKTTITRPGLAPEVYSSIGRWNFMNRNKSQDLKTKEALMISTETYIEAGPGTCNCTITASGPEAASIWVLDQLKNKEIKIKNESRITGPGTNLLNEWYKVYQQE